MTVATEGMLHNIPEFPSSAALSPVAPTGRGDRHMAEARGFWPAEDRLPTVVRFALQVGRWIRSRCIAKTDKPAPLRMIGQMSLGGKRHLALVEVEGTRFLVGGGSENVTAIVAVECKDAAEVATERRA